MTFVPYLLGCLLLVLVPLAQPEPMPPARPPSTVPIAKPPPAAEKFTLPPETVLAIYEDLRQALTAARPGSVILSAEHYEALKERLDRLEKQVRGERKEVLLNACRISGQVTAAGGVRELAELRLDLEFRTLGANVVLPLGLKNARLTKAVLDGETPIWGPASEGLSIQLNEPKVYQLALHLQQPVTRVGGETRLLLDGLPQAAITSLDLTVPGQAASAQVLGIGPVSVSAPEEQRSRLHSEALGSLTQLDLRWTVGVPAVKTGAQQIAVQADALTSFEDTTIDTELRLKVEARQGSFTTLRFRIPSDITVVQVDADPRADGADFAFEPNTGGLTLRLRKPLAASQPALELRVRWQQPYPNRAGSPISVGLFELQGVANKQQTGTLAVWAANERRLRWTPIGALRIDPRELTPAAARTPLFACRYWQQPARIEAVQELTAPVAPQVSIRPKHQLSLRNGVIQGTFEWEVTPRGRAGCQEVELSCPAALALDRNSLLGGPVESVSAVEGTDGVFRLRLASRQTTRFRIKAEARRSGLVDELLTLSFPEVSKVFCDRDARLDPAHLARERGELRIVSQDVEAKLLDGSAGLETSEGRKLDLPLRLTDSAVFGLEAPRNEAVVALALELQPVRQPVRVHAAVYLTSTQSEVVQTLAYSFAGAAPTELFLRVPQPIQSTVRARLSYARADGVTVTVDAPLLDRGPKPAAGAAWVEKLVLLPPDVQGGCEVELTHSGPAPVLNQTWRPLLAAISSQERLAAPAEVPVWASQGRRVRRADGEQGWSSGDPAKLQGSVAPQLSLTAQDLTAPLALRIEPDHEPIGAVLGVERALFEEADGGAGRRPLRARFLLNPVRTETLILRLPALRERVRIERVLLNDVEQAPQSLDAANDSAGAADLILPLQPQHLGQTLRLELQLVLTPESASRTWIMPLQTVVLPQADVVHGVTWRAELPSGALPILWRGSATPEQGWLWLGWLRAPQPTSANAALDEGFSAAESTASTTGPGFSFQQRGSFDAPELLQVGRFTWLLGCSLIVLVLGVGIYALPRRIGRVLLALAVLTVAGLVVLHPALGLAVLYGLQPGLLVLVVLLGAVWVQQQRWRRQVIFLPGFTRLKAGSSLTRGSASRAVVASPSTVDGTNGAPDAPRGSST